MIADSLATYTPGVSERRGGTTRYTHSGLKNTGAQSTNAIVATRVYDAYGMIRSTTGAWSGPFGYRSEAEIPPNPEHRGEGNESRLVGRNRDAGGYGYQEDETGLRLLGHRYYDASTGRFLTRDPIKDGRNWYSYCDGDPINGVDPTGLVRIYLVIIPVTAGVGTGHALLVIVDNVPSSPTYGEVSIVEGARAGLRLEGGRHAPSKQDWSLIGDPLGGSQRDSIFRIMLIDDQSSYSDWTREADKVIKKMKGKKGLGGYDPASKNSNTFLSEVLRRLGLLDIANAELKQPRNRWGGEPSIARMGSALEMNTDCVQRKRRKVVCAGTLVVLVIQSYCLLFHWVDLMQGTRENLLVFECVASLSGLEFNDNRFYCSRNLEVINHKGKSDYFHLITEELERAPDIQKSDQWKEIRFEKDSSWFDLLGDLPPIWRERPRGIVMYREGWPIFSMVKSGFSRPVLP